MRVLTRKEKQEEKRLCKCAYMEAVKYLDPQGVRHWVLCPAVQFDQGKTGSIGLFRYKDNSHEDKN